jgi:RNA polymerase sigma factor (TIGR02999 family)
MSDATRILSQIENGNPTAAEELLPLVYQQLRTLAARELRREPAGLTLQPTALVHEAFIRLVDHHDEARWTHRGHFYAAAATAMRRILVENARRRRSLKAGGSRKRVAIDIVELGGARRPDFVALDDALSSLEQAKPDIAQLVSLRFFAGLTMEQAASAMGISQRTAERRWAYAKAWLLAAMEDEA